MSKQHTPWRAEPLNKHKDRVLDYEVFNSKGESLFFVTRHEHVGIILQAVNNHDRLVEALEQVIEDINTVNYEFGEHMFDEWNQLLNELKA